LSPRRNSFIQVFCSLLLLCLISSVFKPDVAESTQADHLARSAKTPHPLALKLYAQTGSAQSAVAVAIHKKLANQWGTYSGIQNFDRAGYFQIFLGLMGNPTAFPYFAGFAGSSRLRFLNFGAAGFFVGKVASNEKLSDLGVERESRSNLGSGDASGSGRDAFEILDWGVTYIHPNQLHDTHQWRSSAFGSPSSANLQSFASGVVSQVPGVAMNDMRDAYLLLFSGGSYCLAAALKNKEVSKELPQWMKCNAGIATVLARSESSDIDDSFFASLVESESSAPSINCRALGVTGRNGLSLFGQNSAGSKCLLYKSQFEERPGFRTKLHCLDVPGSQHLWKNLEFVDFAVESVKPGRYFVLESRYSPPRVTQIELTEKWSQTVSGGGSSIPGASVSESGKGKLPHGSAMIALPSEEFGQYVCSETVGKDDPSAKLFLVPPPVYRGQRPVNLDEDLVYSYRFDSTAIRDSEILSWRQVMPRYPALDAFPPLTCVFDSSIDVKCGIRALQTSLQLHWEIRSGVLGRVASKNVQTALLGLDRAILRRVQAELRNWGFKTELALLLEESEYLLQDRKANASNEQIQRLQKLQKLQRQLRPTAQWSSYLSVPDGFWTMPLATDY
jgi:hypothetical protein